MWKVLIRMTLSSSNKSKWSSTGGEGWEGCLVAFLAAGCCPKGCNAASLSLRLWGGTYKLGWAGCSWLGCWGWGWTGCSGCWGLGWWGTTGGKSGSSTTSSHENPKSALDPLLNHWSGTNGLRNERCQVDLHLRLGGNCSVAVFRVLDSTGNGPKYLGINLRPTPEARLKCFVESQTLSPGETVHTVLADLCFTCSPAASKLSRAWSFTTRYASGENEPG